MNEIEFSCHFYNVGWTSIRKNFDLLLLEGLQMEAIRFQSDKFLCKYVNSDFDVNGWKVMDDERIAGTVGKKMPLCAISIEARDSIDVFYRVYLRGKGWTAFCCNGEPCGSSLDSSLDIIEGIQIFTKKKYEELDVLLKEADFKVLKYEKIKSQLFIENPEKMLLACTQNYHYDEAVAVTEIEDGVILPLSKMNSTSRDGVFSGGVCDADGNFVAGLDRKRGKTINLCCMEAYPFEHKELKHSEDSVIFGGVFIKHFGHLFAECLSRLWYVIENVSDNDKIAILTIPGEKGLAKDFFSLLGIDLDRIIIVSEPTQYKTVKVPDQTLHLWTGYYDKYHMIYDKMRKNVTPMNYKKIFLTRKAFSKNDSINEEFFDAFYEKQGYTLISPETYSIPEQIAIIAGADEIVCTEGTLSHLILFAKPGIKLVIFRRDYESILTPQLIINQACQIDVTYVDATFNILPTKHAHGCYLYGPTEHFKRYIQQQNFKFDESDIEFDINNFLYEYIEKWCDNYNEVKNFSLISEVDIFDIILRMNRHFGKKKITRSKYVTKGRAKEKRLQEEIKELKSKIEKYSEGS